MKKSFINIILLFLYLALVGYRRITLIVIAFAPLFLWAIGTGTIPNGMIRDEFIYQHQFYYIIGGIIWFPLYIIFGLWLERILVKNIATNYRIKTTIKPPR